MSVKQIHFAKRKIEDRSQETEVRSQKSEDPDPHEELSGIKSSGRFAAGV